MTIKFAHILRMGTNEWKDRLRNAVEDSGKSRRSISTAAGCSPGYLSEVLSEEGPEPTFRNLLAIVDQLSVSLSYIVYGYELSVDEERLLRMFAQLTPDQKDVFLQMAEALAAKD